MRQFTKMHFIESTVWVSLVILLFAFSFEFDKEIEIFDSTGAYGAARAVGCEPNDFKSYSEKITKNEGQIDWKSDALKIIGKINGLYPSPGAFFNFKGQRYKILKAEIGNGIGKNGEVISGDLEIACGGE